MKKTKFPPIEHSVAMSLDTGCIVMIRASTAGNKVVGSLTRVDSVKFAQSILEWIPQTAEAPERPKLTVVN